MGFLQVLQVTLKLIQQNIELAQFEAVVANFTGRVSGEHLLHLIFQVGHLIRHTGTLMLKFR
jgi:hypothetical protein